VKSITLAIMARNAGDTLDGAISPVVPYVDEIVVLLGGESEDDTEAVARKFTDKVYPFKFDRDFSAGRNALMSHCTSDWIFWIDADDVVDHPEKIREIVDDAERLGWGTVQLPYLYQHDEHGNCTVRHSQHRFLRRDLNWQWGCSCRKHPGRVHEVCYSETPHAIHFDERVTVTHHRKDEGGQGQRNYELLRLMESENPRCERTRLALAHCLFSMEKWETALAYFTAYFQEPESPTERWHAACYAAKSCSQMKDWQGVANWGMIAVGLEPTYRDGYILVAVAEWWGQQNSVAALQWLTNAREKSDAPMAVFVTPMDYTLNAWDVEHRCYADIGMYEDAVRVVNQARELIGDDPQWMYFWRLYTEAVRASKSVQAVAHLADHLIRRGDVLKARELVRGYLPHIIESDKRILKVAGNIESMVSHLSDAEKYAATYDEVAHDVIQNPEWARFAFVIERVKALKPKRVLDIGCGNGTFDLYLAQECGCEVVGIDASQAVIDKAMQRKADTGPDLPVEFRQWDVLRSEGDDELGQFDLVLMLEILEHLPGPDAQRMLGFAEEHGERFIASVPGEKCPEGEGLSDPAPRQHVREYSFNEIVALLAKRPERRIWNLHKRSDSTATIIPGFATQVIEWDLKNMDMPRIVFYLGRGLEDWTPMWIDTQGLGGSETAAVRMAEQFATAGFAVVVYAGFEGFVNGVLYQPAERYNPQFPYLGALPAWLLVGSRIPEIAAYANAQHRWLWMHDTDCPTLNEENAAKIHRILVLSDWHAQHVLETVPFVKLEQLIITNNGIDHWVEELQEPQKHRFIYASSPDRGLQVLLEWWPEIRKKWTDAELHVFYGWNNYDATATMYAGMEPFKANVKALMQQPGVFEHARIGQVQLAEEFAKSEFWLYPSVQADGKDWNETYCIAAMEAQANGCIPITRPVGALPERCVFKESLVNSRNFRDIWKRLTYWDKMHADRLQAQRQRMANEARKGTWTVVAHQWLALLNAEERRRLESTLDDEKEMVDYK